MMRSMKQTTERNVVSLDIAGKLKKAGFPQSSYWHYAFPSSNRWVLIWKHDGDWTSLVMSEALSL
jgi:hypothetical protein